MKINRFIGLAVIALLAIGAMGFISMRSYAQAGAPPAAQAIKAASDTEDPASGVDTDQVQEQVGDQSGQDTNSGVSTNSPEAANTVKPVTSLNLANVAQTVKSPDPAVTTLNAAQEVPENASETSIDKADTDNVQVEEQVGDQTGPDTVDQVDANNQ
jgi:hypothetical protein